MTLVKLVIILVLVIVVSVAYGLLRLVHYSKIAGDIVKHSDSYHQESADANKRILVLGDSTAVGTGVVDPSNSVAGRLGRDFPDATIVNKAQNGLKSRGLLENLDDMIDGRYDLVVIHIGANDVLRFRDLKITKQNIRKIVSRSQEQSTYTALITSGDIGEAVSIPWFARPLMSIRSKDLRNFGVNLAKELDNFVYVDLYYKDSGITDEKFYARDMLHLSDEGYGFWHQELKAALMLDTNLYNR